jgi:hypothetical protein
MFPEKDVPQDQRLLKGFSWRLTSRPKDKNDIFRKPEQKENSLPGIKEN